MVRAKEGAGPICGYEAEIGVSVAPAQRKREWVCGQLCAAVERGVVVLFRVFAGSVADSRDWPGELLLWRCGGSRRGFHAVAKLYGDDGGQGGGGHDREHETARRRVDRDGDRLRDAHHRSVRRV